MDKHNISDYNKRILNYDDFDVHDQENIHNMIKINLNTILLVYFNGTEFRGVPLEVFQKYLVIWDKYDNADISIVFCPFTFVSSVYESWIQPTIYTNNNILVYADDNGKNLDILNGRFLNNGSDDDLKRYSVKIGNYRSIMSLYPDCKILVPNTKSKLYDFVNYNKYLKNDKLVYLIQYKSDKNDEIKNSFIVPKGDNTFNLIEGKIDDYFREYEQKIKDKECFIIPVLWSYHDKICNKCKIIEL